MNENEGLGEQLSPKRTRDKILIGLPFGRPQDMASHQAWTALVARATANTKYTVCGEYAATANVAFNREYIVQAALKKNCNWCLMVDTDMSYPDSLLDILMSRNKDVIGVPYYSGVKTKKGTRIVPVIYDYNEKGDSWTRWKKVKQTELFKVDGVGGGIMLVKTSIFERLEKPWFIFAAAKGHSRFASEDVSFCMKCREAKIDIWIDPTFGDDIKHWHVYGYSKKDCSEGGSPERLPTPT